MSLAHGRYTELKDKIISLKDEWTSDHYRSIADTYLQTALEFLVKPLAPFDLATVSECLKYATLADLVRTVDDKSLLECVIKLKHYHSEDITGLRARLDLLIQSEPGDYFKQVVWF